MSYDLDALHAKYGLKEGSVRFATISDAAGTTIIPGVTGAIGVVHQVFFTASAWCQAQLSRSTGAASSYWTGFAGQTALMETARVPTDVGASVFLDMASVGVVSGSGVFRVWFTYQPGNTSGASIGNL